MSQTTPASRGTWRWQGSCSLRTGPARRSPCSAGLHAAAAAQDRRGSLIETGALLALARAATGDEAAAITAPRRGDLILACPQGYVRVFADEGPPMAALLARLIAAQRSGAAAAEVPLGCLARLQRAWRPLTRALCAPPALSCRGPAPKILPAMSTFG